MTPAAGRSWEGAKRDALRAPGASGPPVASNLAWYERHRGDGADRPVLRKPTRTLSGVAVVAVMTAPAPCPHGRCTYCPGGVELGSPQSYTGEEPAAMRGAQFNYETREIVRHRLAALEAIGHPTSKVEAILMGGTFPARPARYVLQTFHELYDGLNGSDSPDLPTAQLRNERADRRLVGLTVETRPDWCDHRVLPTMLDAGVTRVEIGVECLDDGVLKAVNRAHASGDVERATRAARDVGMKVGYHWMLGLPGMDPGKDEAGFRRLFDEPAFRPDFLKIYPTLVLPGTPLYEEWRRGAYAPYDTEKAVALLARLKSIVPPWVRIHRIQRDIPVRRIADGVRASNLRQLAQERMRAEGRRCRCLRCREAGRLATPDLERFRVLERTYRAGMGEEWFLAFEDPETDAVAGYLRLRFPSEGTEGGLDAPVIRELKVLGAEVPIGGNAREAPEYQHRGLGQRLVARAEALARARGATRIYVRSAVGTREYYRKRGYERIGAQMAKRLCA